jgi:hypothetical protein
VTPPAFLVLLQPDKPPERMEFSFAPRFVFSSQVCHPRKKVSNLLAICTQFSRNASKVKHTRHSDLPDLPDQVDTPNTVDTSNTVDTPNTVDTLDTLDILFEKKTAGSHAACLVPLPASF